MVSNFMEMYFLNYVFLEVVLKFHCFAFPKQMLAEDEGGRLDMSKAA